MTKRTQLGRRDALRLAVGGMSLIGATGLLTSPAVAAPTKQSIKLPAPGIGGRPNPNVRSLSLVNLHSDEKVSCVYYVDGKYQPDALARIAAVMRDVRSGEIHKIDPDLIDLLSALQSKLDSGGPMHLISGYRASGTNEMLAQASRGVARNSYHIQGMAADIRIPGRGLNQVRDAALNMKIGGVGYYASSNFVHVDVGPVRRW